MAFELGRKLGLTASLILVIIPVLMVFPFGYYTGSLFSTFSLVSNYLTGGLYSVTGAPLPSLESTMIQYLALASIGVIVFITFILGVRWLGQYYKEPDTFKNAIYGMILALAGAGSASAVIISVVISATASAKVFGKTTIVAPITGTIPVLLTIMIIAAYILEIIGAVFYMRMFNKLREKSGVRNFNTAGILYLVGIILTIVAIGGLIVWIAWIYAASGFNSLKPKLAESSNLSRSEANVPLLPIAQ